ncbi:MAG: hypothetical protein GX628_02430 [Clostridiales bacterium]|nr:hypothetical protein [Clostridiales bacterium]
MKTLTSILIISLLMLSLNACSSGTTDNITAETTAVSTEAQTEAVITAALEVRDTGGFELKLGKPTQANMLWSNISFAVAEENGEVLNDEIYRRNQKICELYNCSIAETELSNAQSTVTSETAAGDTTYDIYLIELSKAAASSREGIFLNFHELPVLELEGKWWDQDMLRDLNIYGGQYFMNGDVIFSVYDNLRTIMYSKHLAEDLQLGDFYPMAESGGWTVDIMLSMTRIATADLNGDGIMDYRDRFGLLYNNSSYSAFMTSQGFRTIENSGDGMAVNILSEKFVKVYDNLVKIFEIGQVFHYNNDKYPGLTARQAITTMFDAKQALFFENGMSAASQYMRNVENVDFGFLPCPKLDEAQDRYYSFVAIGAPVLTFPITTAGERLENSCLIIEALCRESSESVVPVYFETCFSNKYTRDEKSYEMILLATESRTYDIGLVFNPAKMLDIISTGIKNNQAEIMSSLTAVESAIDVELKDLDLTK